MKMRYVLLAIFTLALIGGASYGQVVVRGGGGWGWGGGGGQVTVKIDRIMVEIKTLTAEQTAQLKALATAMDKDFKELEKEHQDVMNGMFQKGGRGGIDKWGEEMASQQKETESLTEEYGIKINAILTAEQRTSWEKSQMSPALATELAKLDLTAEQKATIEKLTLETAQTIAGAKTLAAGQAAKAALARKIITEVLTPAQAAKLAGLQL